MCLGGRLIHDDREEVRTPAPSQMHWKKSIKVGSDIWFIEERKISGHIAWQRRPPIRVLEYVLTIAADLLTVSGYAAYQSIDCLKT